MTTRRQFLRTGFAGLAGLVLSLNASNVYSETKQNDSKLSTEKLKEDYPRLLNELPKDEKELSIKYYNTLDEEDKTNFKEIFTNPRDYIKKTFKTKKEKKEFSDYFDIGIEKMKKEDIEELNNMNKNLFPWNKDVRVLCNLKKQDDLTNAKRLWEFFYQKSLEKSILGY